MVSVAALVVVLAACGSPAQDTVLVHSSDPVLGARVSELLPRLAEMAEMDLLTPIRAERRTREQLEAYLRFKLDQEFPPEQAEKLTRSYALLGLLGEDVDLRGLLLSVYTEQVAGFYDPDSTALFVMDDLSGERLDGLIVHELVHAVQDQTANLDSLTAEERGNDRQVAAQSAIEGHATLIMFEYMSKELGIPSVDFTNLPDLSLVLGPALEAQYPALASAPAILQQSLFFPYLEGASFVAALWKERGGHPAPFGSDLPQSTEQVLNPSRLFGMDRDPPTELEVALEEGYEVLFENSLGQMELTVLLAEHKGQGAEGLAQGWDGDRYVLVRSPSGEEGMVWASVWDAETDRDRFLSGFQGSMTGFPVSAVFEPIDLGGRPGAILRLGISKDVLVTVREGPAR
jgi:hypothetical protein